MVAYEWRIDDVTKVGGDSGWQAKARYDDDLQVRITAKWMDKRE